MAEKTWVLTDQSESQPVGDLVLDENVLGIPGVTVSKRTLRGGLRDGVEAIEINNGRLRIVVLPTRGMGIWKAWTDRVELGWQSPIPGPVHPQFVPLTEPAGLGWLGGFDELLCRCGLESNGPPVFDAQGRLLHPLHGRIANLPAHRVEVVANAEKRELRLVGQVDESRFLFQRLRLTTTITTRRGDASLQIHDQIENLSGNPGEFQLLYHLNLGHPLLGPASRLVAPVKELVPKNERAAEGIESWDVYSDEQPGFEEQVYLFDLYADNQGQTQVMLANAAGDAALSVGFNKQALPHFIQWKNTAAAADGYVTGLEPAVNFPNPRSFEKEQGRVRTLGPGERFECGLTIQVLENSEAVQQAETAIRQLQREQPKIHQTPQPGWAPA